MRLAALLLLTSFAHAAALDDTTRQLARDIFRELIEINTTDSVGSTTRAAEAMAKRLKNAGFPAADIQVLGPNDRKGNMVARYRGTGTHKPVLIIATWSTRSSRSMRIPAASPLRTAGRSTSALKPARSSMPISS